MKTNFQKTARTLGDFGAQFQEANRTVMLIFSAIRSPVGLAIMIFVTLASSILSASYGFADLMYIQRLQSEAGNLGLSISSPEVIAAAHDSAFWSGLPFVAIVSLFILYKDLVGNEAVAVRGAIIECLLGVAGYMYRSYKMGMGMEEFTVTVACSLIFVGAVPYFMHMLAAYFARTYKELLAAFSDHFNELLKADLQELMK